MGRSWIDEEGEKCSEEQIAYDLRQDESGTAVADVCRRLGTRDATFCIGKKCFVSLGVSALRKLRSLEAENRRLRPAMATSTGPSTFKL